MKNNRFSDTFFVRKIRHHNDLTGQFGRPVPGFPVQESVTDLPAPNLPCL